jgi:two-component system phosphate regulon sensor histidine kinase PhoR
MIGSQLFWKLFGTFVGLTLLASLALSVLAYRWQYRLVEDRFWQQLSRATELADEADRAGGLGGDGPATLVARVAALADSRISMIDLQGQLLADSAIDAKELANQGDESLRPEVQGALARGESRTVRLSLLTGEPTMFFARRMDRNGAPVGVVRAAVPRQQIAERLGVLAGVLATMSSAITLVAGLVTYVVVRRIVRPVVMLNEAARGVARGDYEQRVFVPGNDELAELARSFNFMSFELANQVSELRASDQRQATVLGGMVEGVVAVDNRQRVLFANAAAGRQFGFVPDDVQSRPLLEVIRHHLLHGMLQKAINESSPQQLDMQWDTPRERQLAVQITPLPGRPCPGAVIVLHDNTELRRLETIRSEFMANVSHELKTPLSSIKAYCETLINGAIDDREHRMTFLERIAEQGDRLNDLIQDMLKLARIESEQQQFELVRLSVPAMAAKCAKNYAALAEAKQIALEVADGPLLHVVADEEGLRVIIDNLVDNAVKYTPMGGRVHVGWEQTVTGSVRLSVTDNGPGIPRADLPRIFERFYRVDKARSRELGSTGLGLSIVKHLAQSFGGTSGVESTLGRGSTFWVELPAAAEPVAAAK